MLAVAVEIFTIVCLIVALFYNAFLLENRKTVWRKFKFLTIVASIAALVIWYKELIKYAPGFLVWAIISTLDKKRKNGKRNETVGYK
jgi:hypothetical protein